ncbi:hepatic leukemia factor-like [Saccostrea cucullata]|uniref:hepatic leukemia factor-like n=1 Tax=Saccostrea cuccullata TaxID=36930 RepID=UPI002ED605E7
MMQDPYSIMHRDDRFYKYGGHAHQRTTATTGPPGHSSSYYSMSMPYQEPSHTLTQSDLAVMSSQGHSSTPPDFSAPRVPTGGNGHSPPSLMPGPSTAGPSTSHQSSSAMLPIMDLNSPIPTGEPIPNVGSHETPSQQDLESSHLSSPSSTSSGPSTPLDLANQGPGDNKIPPKKRPHLTPENQKDEMYWEKRQKNNESAKRSREARRMKEEQIALRVVFLEQENLQLRTEVSLLKSEIEKLRCMLYNP